LNFSTISAERLAMMEIEIGTTRTTIDKKKR